jgi:hypothetical protein
VDFQARYEALAKAARECAPQDAGEKGIPEIDLDDEGGNQAAS